MVQLKPALLALATSLAIASANPVASFQTAPHTGYDAKNLYTEVFSTEEQARSSQGVKAADNPGRVGRTLCLIHNNDPDYMVVKASFGKPEYTALSVILPPGGWGVIGNVQVGEARRIEAYPGCDHNGIGCMNRADLTTLVEWTDGGDRKNVDASINLSIGMQPLSIHD